MSDRLVAATEDNAAIGSAGKLSAREASGPLLHPLDPSLSCETGSEAEKTEKDVSAQVHIPFFHCEARLNTRFSSRAA
jgi:hypothetical protein